MATAKTQQAFIVSTVLVTYVILTIKASSLLSYSTNEASEYNLESRIFSANYKSTLQRQRRETTEECSKNYTVDAKGGNFTSPGYPLQYPNSVHCEWRLESSTTSNVILKFTDVSIEETDDCGYDYLAIYDAEDNMVEKICGSHTNKLVFVNSTTASITFHSDDTYTEGGFALEYFMEVASNCQTILNENEGVLTSPLYPDNYPDRTDCHTTIIVEPSAVINLKFDVLSLEFDADCDYDYVNVYDGATTDSPLLGHFCSNPENAMVTSTNNTMIVHFHSDQLLNYNGFSATYTSIFAEKEKVGDCIWNKGKNNGTITSPNYPEKYPGNSFCAIKIESPEGTNISISIDVMKLENAPNCSYDRLEIRDGRNEESPLLGYFCGQPNEVRQFTSKADGVYITFTSDSFTEYDGFLIEYRIDEIENDDLLPSSAIPPPTFIPASPHSFIEHPQDFTAILGESHIMPCKPADSEAKVQWMKDGKILESIPNLDLLEGGKILWIHSMSEELEGTYTCTAVTPDGASYSIHAQLGTTERAENCNLIFRHIPKNTTILEGDTIFLECSLSTSKSTQITWIKNGVPIENTRHYQHLINGFLLIADASVQLNGVYTCVAKEEVTGCVRQYSALLLVSPRININGVCGRPITGKPNKEKPQMMHGKVVGGTRSTRGAYPWQVMLTDVKRGTFCGGTLLNERWVVTAAHCLYIGKPTQLIDASIIIIKLGKYNQFVKEPEEVVTGVKDYFPHPEFDKDTYNNDIAMVKLTDSIKFTDYISPACMGDQKFIRDIFFEKNLPMGTITGWGRLTERGPQPQYLQELRIPIADWEICKQSTNYVVTKNMFCAGYAQEIIGDACKGDSGGPFVMEHDNIWYLVGVVSWGEGCGRVGHYGFYTKVDNYHLWINSMIN